jgi:hypothetical protein
MNGAGAADRQRLVIPLSLFDGDGLLFARSAYQLQEVRAMR